MAILKPTKLIAPLPMLGLYGKKDIKADQKFFGFRIKVKINLEITKIRHIFATTNQKLIYL